jgi:hypothetical protein
LRHAIFGDPAPQPPAQGPDRVTFVEVRAAAQFDATAFRALWRIHGMVQKPAEVYADPEVVSRTRQALARNQDRSPIAEPTREQLMAALAV